MRYGVRYGQGGWMRYENGVKYGVIYGEGGVRYGVRYGQGGEIYGRG